MVAVAVSCWSPGEGFQCFAVRSHGGSGTCARARCRGWGPWCRVVVRRDSAGDGDCPLSVFLGSICVTGVTFPFDVWKNSPVTSSAFLF